MSWVERTGDEFDVRIPFTIDARLTLHETRRLVSDLTRALFASALPAIKGGAKRVQPCPGGRRAFASENAARAANKTARFRYRPYRCDGCGKWHVCNSDKSRDGGRPKGA